MRHVHLSRQKTCSRQKTWPRASGVCVSSLMHDIPEAVVANANDVASRWMQMALVARMSPRVSRELVDCGLSTEHAALPSDLLVALLSEMIIARTIGKSEYAQEKIPHLNQEALALRRPYHTAAASTARSSDPGPVALVLVAVSPKSPHTQVPFHDCSALTLGIWVCVTALPRGRILVGTAAASHNLPHSAKGPAAARVADCAANVITQCGSRVAFIPEALCLLRRG